MADDIALSIKVSGSDSLASLKKEFKDLQKELESTKTGSEKYLETLKRLGKVKDDIGDLRDTISALNPEGKVAAFQNVAGKLAGGFQAATGAAALFGGKAEEVEKALLKVQAASALAEGIRSIAGLGDAFSVASTVIKTQMITALSTLKGALLATGIGAAAVALGVLIAEAIKYNEALDEEFDKQKKVNEELKKTTDEYYKQAEASEALRNAREGGLNELQRELKLYEAQGASAQALADAKLRIANKEIENLKIRRATIEGDSTLERELTQKILDKENERQVILVANEERKRKEFKKTYDEKKKLADDEEKEQIKRELDAQAREAAVMNAQIDREEAEKEKKEKQAQDDAELFESLYLEQSKKQDEQSAVDYEKFKLQRSREVEATKVAAQEQEDAKIRAAQNGLTALNTLSTVFFAGQLAKAKGNQAEELKIRKKMFEVDKAFAVARIAIDGIRSVQAALTIPPPGGYILAAINAALAIAMGIKVATTKFDGGSSGGDTSMPTLPSSGGGSIPAPPPPAPARQDLTRLDSQGNNLSQPPANQRVYVVETDISDSSNRVTRLQEQASF